MPASASALLISPTRPRIKRNLEPARLRSAVRAEELLVAGDTPENRGGLRHVAHRHAHLDLAGVAQQLVERSFTQQLALIDDADDVRELLHLVEQDGSRSARSCRDR